MDGNENGDDHPASFLSRSFERGGKFLKGDYDEKWDVVSPMTQRILCGRSDGEVPPKLRRRRSQSFNDYIDEVAGAAADDDDDAAAATRESSPLLFRSWQGGGGGGDGDGDGGGAPNSQNSLNWSNHIQGDKQNEALPQRYQSCVDPIQADCQQEHDQEQQVSTSQEEQLKNEPPPNPAWICVLYGIINATIVIPVVMSFGNIIYQNAAFSPYMPVLIKLTMVSGVVHQLCFSTFSSLPFAVGSVQDAGLIFLSSMATSMVEYCRNNAENKNNEEAMLATVTVGLGLAAALLGIGLVVIGKLRLAGYVQMLPTCVVAGYLAFIGFFCGKSGILLMAGGSGDTPFLELVLHNWVLIAPGIVGGLFIYYSVRRFRHVAVLPITIIILILIFYLSLAISGCSLEEATDKGWIRKAEPAPVWYRTWDYIQPSKVIWSALPRLVITELSMIFVVALSSSLDVAAIELEVKRPLKYNQELIVVGMSNIASGLTGGYTGSYIFSQTIFSLRAGIRERLAGFVLAFSQLAVIVAPVPILAFVPNFFYGSLLLMICLDLMYEWLWEFRSKVTRAEYVIGLATFGLIQLLQVEFGIIAGVILYVISRRVGIDVGELKVIADDEDE